jgi:hypothetical protein
MTHVDFWLKDLNCNIPLYVDIRGGFPAHVMIGIVPKGFGDIELAFECEDGDRIAAILDQSSQAVSLETHGQLTHSFKNLDGGADATFRVLPTRESVTITVERSDEGTLEFRLSLEDSKRLADSLKSACSIPTKTK